MLTAVGGLVGYLGGKAGGKVFNSAVVVIAGTVTSFLGFTRVVSLFYPLVGVVGLIYIVMCVKFVCKAAKPRKKIFGKGVQSVDKSSTGGGILNT